MKIFINLLHVLSPGLLTLLSALALSSVSDINWKGLIFLSVLLTICQISVWYKTPERLPINAEGWIVVGFIYAFAASKDIVKEYEPIFSSLGMILMAFVFFFVYIPTLTRKK